MFTETITTQEIIILPLENNVQIKRRTVVKKDGDLVSTKDHYQLYSADNTEAVAILQAHNAQGIADAATALAAKATAEAALTAAQAQIATLQAQIDAYTPPVPVAPSFITVSPRQIRMALTQAGLRTSVEAAVSQGSQALKDWYEFAEAFEENNANVTAMADALGVSDEALHDLFALASGL